jgi:hypothetical protein
MYGEQEPLFQSHREMYWMIDSISLGNAPWQSFAVKYTGPLPENPPTWMTAEYDIWHCDPLTVLESQIGNPDFAGCIDYAPKVVTDEAGEQEVSDLMSGQWAWDQCVCISFFYFHSSIHPMARKLLHKTRKPTVPCSHPSS